MGTAECCRLLGSVNQSQIEWKARSQDMQPSLKLNHILFFVT